MASRRTDSPRRNITGPKQSGAKVFTGIYRVDSQGPGFGRKAYASGVRVGAAVHGLLRTTTSY